MGAAAQAEPQLRRVVLSSSGVGQFEFDGEVDGAASVPLDVPLDQVDDVLKSLVVDDPAGPLLGVRLPGQQPLAESFRTLPFKPDAFASSESLLASLVGETVSIPASGAHGAILSVSAFELAGAPGQPSVTRHRLAIATSDGVATAVLEDTPDIGLPSAALRAQIAAALSAIAAQRVQDRRILIEQPKAVNAPLVEPTGKGVTSTPEVYRVSRDLPAGTTQPITLVTERTLAEGRALGEADPAAMNLLLSGGELPGTLKQMVQHVMALRQDVAARQAALDALGAQEQAITTDQQRIRADLASVPIGLELHRRYLAKMQAQEDRLGELHDSQDRTRAQLEQAQTTLSSTIEGLKF